ncbi:sel1 repeat family protein [Hyphomicrobium sp.]|jgi:localization factor PodJL|uniref:sel1 repeat family protein n=1 Tax=Hyphomicrobium sp. TaxID=82 RepID=UPI003569289D
MSNSEMSAERRGDTDPIESGDDGRDELKSMLDTIAAQLQDADRRHTAALDEMQNRISGMGREADTLRARIPDQFAPAFEQIEAGIGELAHRLADTGKESRTADRSAGYPGSAPRARSDAVDPWNQGEADALARPYGFADGVTGTASGEAGSGTSGASRIDEAWLESRFAEIARGIEYSLAHVKPENGLSEFGERLDQFEAQFAKAFGGSANHDDFSAVRQIGAHMEAVVLRLEKTSDQLERLNTIEFQLASVSRTLADMQAAASHAKSADIDAVARAVAEETAHRFAARHADDKNSAADELRPLIQQLMRENRQGGEQTAALLDTMQQAMVRLLDRAEAVEFTPPPPLRGFEPEAPVSYAGFGGATEMFGSDVLRDEDLTSGGRSDAFGVTRTSAAFSFPGTASPPPLSEPYDREMSPEEMALRSEKLRQEFIADARRAQARLTAEGDVSASSLPSQSRGTKTTAGGSRPIRRSTSVPANTSGPTAPSPRLMIVAGLVLVALAGLWCTFGFENRTNPVATHQLAPAQGTDAGASDAAKSAPTDSKEPSALPAPDGNGPRGDLAPGGDDHSRNTASNDEASQSRTTLPMLGVAVDLNDHVSEAELQQARRHQAMANLSGELGNAAARPGEAVLVPASMVPTEAETEGAGGQNDALPSGDAKASQIDMPPAMIGPLSFRVAASKGDPSAEFEVGARFAEGEGVKQDFAEAAKWYRRSADQGFAQAQYRLATLYERGLGLKADRGQATNWYLLAAKQGNIKAMHNLAVLSANQTDRSPDYTSAALWFEEAAKRGLPDSQYNLAVLYENGLGVTRNQKTAFMWLSLAARAGDADATRRRDVLRGKLTAEEIAETDKLVAAWTIMPTDRTINDALVAGELWKKDPKNGING